MPASWFFHLLILFFMKSNRFVSLQNKAGSTHYFLCLAAHDGHVGFKAVVACGTINEISLIFLNYEGLDIFNDAI